MTSRLMIGATLLAGLLMVPSLVSQAAVDANAGQPAAPAAVTVHATQTRQASVASPIEIGGATYAQREANAPGLESFAGGSRGIYIGGSTVVLVLLIVLIVLIV